MKTIFFFLFAILSMSCSQKKATVKNEEIITQQVVNKKGNQLVIKEIINDSRCPEDVSCVWAGEVEVLIAVYNNNKYVKEENIKISQKLSKQNIEWFSKYYPQNKIKEIATFPLPKSDKIIKKEDYYLKVIF